jgi:hypothetical protein
VARALRIPAVLIASILVVNAFFFPGAVDVITRLGPIALSWDRSPSAGHRRTGAGGLHRLDRLPPGDPARRPPGGTRRPRREPPLRLGGPLGRADGAAPAGERGDDPRAQQARGLEISGSLGRRVRALVRSSGRSCSAR